MRKLWFLAHENYPRLPARTETDPAARADRVAREFVGDVAGMSFRAYGEEAGPIMSAAAARGARLGEPPYDRVVLYDVLDHLPGDQEAFLAAVYSETSPGGIAFVRCHPWCAKDACHLQGWGDKAYLHLLFGDRDRELLGMYGRDTFGVGGDPLAAYARWFSAVGLAVLYEEAVRVPCRPPMARRFVREYFGVDNLPDIEFVDYVLAKA